MKKGWIIAIVLIIIVILAVVYLNKSSKTEKSSNTEGTTTIQESDYKDIQTSNDDFSAIDETIDYLE